MKDDIGKFINILYLTEEDQKKYNCKNFNIYRDTLQ